MLLYPLLIVAIVLAAGSAIAPQTDAARPESTRSPEPRRGFAGDAACFSCHREQAAFFAHTAHHLTSQDATSSTILGSFTHPANTLLIADAPGEPRLSFTMEARADGFFQTAVAENGQDRFTRTERFGLVIGSGTRGQTYLYWRNNSLFELPVSYWTDGHQWINSPGYRDGTANFARHVDPRCLECHATYIQPLSPDPQTNLYEKSTFVPGISCESCHGPGASHVVQQSHASSGAVKNAEGSILNPAHFSRDRQIDACALCHNGAARQQLAPAFTYMPGEPLDRFLAPAPLDIVDSHPDVHGNQVGLLERSRCFLASPAMTCSTCHNVHAPEQPAVAYSERCLSCHQWQSCGVSKRLGSAIKRDCITCHMPLQETVSIVSVTAGKSVRASIRTHWIKVYPEVQ